MAQRARRPRPSQVRALRKGYNHRMAKSGRFPKTKTLGSFACCVTSYLGEYLLIQRCYIKQVISKVILARPITFSPVWISLQRLEHQKTHTFLHVIAVDDLFTLTKTTRSAPDHRKYRRSIKRQFRMCGICWSDDLSWYEKEDFETKLEQFQENHCTNALLREIWRRWKLVGFDAAKAAREWVLALPGRTKHAVVDLIDRAKLRHLRYVQRRERLLVRQEAPFLTRLPTEIRLQIYRHVMNGELVHCYPQGRERPKINGVHPGRLCMDQLAMLHVSRQVRHEAMEGFDKLPFTIEALEWSQWYPDPSVAWNWRKMKDTWGVHHNVEQVRLNNLNHDSIKPFSVYGLHAAFPKLQTLRVSCRYAANWIERIQRLYPVRGRKERWCCAVEESSGSASMSVLRPTQEPNLVRCLQRRREWHEAQAAWWVEKTGLDVIHKQGLCDRDCKHMPRTLVFNFERQVAYVYVQGTTKRWVVTNEEVLDVLFGVTAEENRAEQGDDDEDDHGAPFSNYFRRYDKLDGKITKYRKRWGASWCWLRPRWWVTSTFGGRRRG